MAHAIPRTGSGFLAKENTFGSGGAGNDFYYVPAVTMTRQPVINYATNDAGAGSSYMMNDARPDTGYCDLTLEFKVREELLPLLLLNKYDLTSTPVVGDTDVIEHVAEYNGRNVGTTYDFIFRFSAISDESYRGFVIHDMSWTVESGQYIKVTITGRSNLMTSTSETPTITASPEFASRNFVYEQSIGGASLNQFRLKAFSAQFQYGQPEDTDEIGLGAFTREIGFTTADQFSLQATALMPDYSLRDAWIAGDTFATIFGCTDTTREVVGSNTGIHPSIKVETPYGKVTEWSEPGDMNSLRNQQYTITSLDGVGVTDAPHKITIINNVASY